jgi:hypothetical protein
VNDGGLLGNIRFVGKRFIGRPLFVSAQLIR